MYARARLLALAGLLLFLVPLEADSQEASPAEPRPPAAKALNLRQRFAPVYPNLGAAPDLSGQIAVPPNSVAESIAPAFIWPAAGPVSSYFDRRHPLGIDIGLAENPAGPVIATRAGIVSFVGGDPCCSYGLHVQVDHGNRLTSLYAHLSHIEVAHGLEVKQGQLLGLGGETGTSSGGEHLHFEIVEDGVYLDPLAILGQPADPID